MAGAQGGHGHLQPGPQAGQCWCRRLGHTTSAVGQDAFDGICHQPGGVGHAQACMRCGEWRVWMGPSGLPAPVAQSSSTPCKSSLTCSLLLCFCGLYSRCCPNYFLN